MREARVAEAAEQRVGNGVQADVREGLANLQGEASENSGDLDAFQADDFEAADQNRLALLDTEGHRRLRRTRERDRGVDRRFAKPPLPVVDLEPSHISRKLAAVEVAWVVREAHTEPTEEREHRATLRLAIDDGPSQRVGRECGVSPELEAPELGDGLNL